MKKIILFCFLSATLYSCKEHKEEVKTEPVVIVEDTTLMFFGDSISVFDGVDAKLVVSKLKGKDSISIKLTGLISEVCQKKGCWMNMDIGNEQSMKVRFKDYSFFVPKDAAGKTVYIEGYAFNDTISVADQKHYAEDAGSTKEEIAKITKPQISISFEANGVIIKK